MAEFPEDQFDDHPLPSGILPDVQAVLRKLILEDPAGAWEYLQNDPLAVIGLPKVKKEISKNNHETLTQFQEDYNKKVDHIFDVGDLLHEHGAALTIEFLIERWRRQNQRLFFDRETVLLLDNLISIKTILTEDEKVSNKKILLDMVNDSIRRIASFEQYEKEKAEGNWTQLEPYFSELVKQSLVDVKMLSSPKSGQLLESLLSLATMKHISAEVLRRGIAKLVLDQLKSEFDDLDEDKKFKFAPWIPLLERITK